jgi:hypothetical protein
MGRTILAAIVALTALIAVGCGGDSADVSGTTQQEGSAATSHDYRQFAPANLIFEDGRIADVSCSDPHGPRHDYPCRFRTTSGETGAAKVRVTDAGQGYVVDHCVALEAGSPPGPDPCDELE